MSKCIVVAGGAASGKTTLAAYIQSTGRRRIITYTTREKREGEVDGIDYHFISEEEFYEKLYQGFFAEHTHYVSENGLYYYASAKEDYVCTDGTVIILDPIGVMELTVYGLISMS